MADNWLKSIRQNVQFIKTSVWYVSIIETRELEAQGAPVCIQSQLPSDPYVWKHLIIAASFADPSST